MNPKDSHTLSELVAMISEATNLFSQVLSYTQNDGLKEEYQNSLKLIENTEGVLSKYQTPRDKMKLILGAFEGYLDQLTMGENENISAITRTCLNELTTVLEILEKSYIDTSDSKTLKKIIRGLILRIDTTIVETRNKSVKLLNFNNNYAKIEAQEFFTKLDNYDDYSDGKRSFDRPSVDHKKITELEMKLATKDSLINNYIQEIEKLSTTVRTLQNRRNSNDNPALNEIMNEIMGLNQTIEHLKAENLRLKASLGIVNNDGERFYGTHGRLRINEVEGLVDKLHILESKLSTTDGSSKSRLLQLEEELFAIRSKNMDLKEDLRSVTLEKEAILEGKEKTTEEIKRVASIYEELKKKSLELIKRTNKIESENVSIRKDKNQLVENILNLQRTHQEELQNLRDAQDTLTEKMYILNLENENKETVLELEKKYVKEKEELKEGIFQEREDKNKLKAKVGQLEMKSKEQEDIIYELSQTQKLYVNGQEKIAKLEDTIDSLETTLGEEKLRVKDYRKDADRANDQLKKAQKDRSEAREECGFISKERERISKENKELEVKLIQLKKEFNLLKNQVTIEEKKVSEGLMLKKEYEEQSERNNQVLKLSKVEITELNYNLGDKKKEIEQLEKDRLFFKKKVERLEDQLFEREKSFVRQEAQRDLNTEDQLKFIIEDNHRLKEEVIVLERVNMRLHKDLNSHQKEDLGGIGINKLNQENERLRELFKRAELNWLKEKQDFLNEISLLKDNSVRGGPSSHLGYVSVRPERDDSNQKFLSTYGSVNSKLSKKGLRLLDTTASKSRMNPM